MLIRSRPWLFQAVRQRERLMLAEQKITEQEVN
jgi:hypothetical protein